MNNKDPYVSKNKMDNVINYAKSNKEEVFVYFALALGILSLLLFPKIGEFILGALTGYYFSEELSRFIQGTRRLIQEQGRVRYAILVVILLALFLNSPTFFITGILMAAIKQFISANTKP